MREKLKIKCSNLHIFEKHICKTCRYNVKFSKTECNILGELFMNGESEHVTYDPDDNETKNPVCDRYEDVEQ